MMIEVDTAAFDSESTVRRILTSSKYRDISEETVRDVVVQILAGLETGHRGAKKQTYRKIRERLHRIWAPYLGLPKFERSATALKRAFESGDSTKVEATCIDIISCHHSSHERVSILREMYKTLFERTGHPGGIHDLACALNPLTFRWMDLPRSIDYHAYDINRKTVDLINHYFSLEGIKPLAEHRDILCRPPDAAVDVGLLLKMYHCLERRRRGAGWEVVEKVPVRWLAVSFPTRSLASRTVNLTDIYERQIRPECQERGWSCERLDFEGEAMLLIGKDSHRI
jgi:16S rRNA (guanine(1405)-N(7))-methyltransferase